MLKQFKEFAMKGNVIDMAVGIIIGGAFGKIVSSLVNDVIMPPFGVLIGNMDFSDLAVTLKAAEGATKPVTLNYGLFLNNILNFLIIAFSIFMVVKGMNRLKKKEATAIPTTKECLQCLSVIPIKAVKCAHCTSPVA